VIFQHIYFSFFSSGNYSKNCSLRTKNRTQIPGDLCRKRVKIMLKNSFASDDFLIKLKSIKRLIYSLFQRAKSLKIINLKGSCC